MSLATTTSGTATIVQSILTKNAAAMFLNTMRSNAVVMFLNTIAKHAAAKFHSTTILVNVAIVQSIAVKNAANMCQSTTISMYASLLAQLIAVQHNNYASYCQTGGLSCLSDSSNLIY